MKYVDIRYNQLSPGTYPLSTTSRNGGFDVDCTDPKHPATNAVFREGENFAPGMDPRRGLLVMCPRAFTYPDLPADDDDSKCTLLTSAKYLTWEQKTLSSVIFHELLHDSNLNMKVIPAMAGGNILDYWKKNDTQATAAYPINGYGSWNSMILQQVTSKTADRWYIPLRNADSYMSFAL